MKPSHLSALLLSLASTTIAFAQAPKPDMQKAISYRTVAIPVSQALSDLSKSVGTRLVADGDLADERIILRLDGVPAQTALDKIAEACSAEWRPAKEGLELFRSPALVDRLQQADMDRRVARIRDSIQKMAADAATDGRMTQAKAVELAQYTIRTEDLLGTGNRPPFNAAANIAAGRPAAETRLIAQLLAAMDPKEIAALAPGARYVYTPKPNAMQRQLTGFDDGEIRAYIEDQNLFVDAVLNQVKKVKGQVPPDVASSYVHINDPNLKVFLVLEPSITDESVTVFLSIINSRRIPVGWTMAQIGKRLSGQEYRSQVDLDRIKANEKGLEVDPDLKLLMHRFDHDPKTPNEAPLDPALSAALLTPTEHDPLSFFCSRLVLEAADNENLNVVFVPSDICESAAMSACRSGKFTRELLTMLMIQSGDMDCTDTDGWFIGKPNSPLLADQLRCPRPALEAYLQSIQEKGYVSIENQVSFVMTTAYGTTDILPSLLKTEIWGKAPSLDNYPSESTIRLYGSLNEEQKMAAKQGITLPYAQLTPDQQKWLNWFVFTGELPFAVSQEVWDKIKNGDWQYVYGEKTELTPNGILPGDTFTLSEKTEPVVYYSESFQGQMSIRTSATVEDAAAEIASAEGPQDPASPHEMNHFSVGSRRQIILKLVTQGTYEMEGTIDENRGGDLKGVPGDKLADVMTPDVRDRFLAALEKTRQRIKQYRQKTSAPTPAPQVAPPSLFLNLSPIRRVSGRFSTFHVA